MRCTECNGRGEVLDAPSNVLGGRAYWEKCSECKGTGQIMINQRKCNVDWCIAMAPAGSNLCVVHQEHGRAFGPPRPWTAMEKADRRKENRKPWPTPWDDSFLTDEDRFPRL